MQTPMVGNWTVQVKEVRPFLIHGDLYYELHVIRSGDAPDQIVALKVPQHAAAGEPRVGQTLELTFLMGQVTGVKPK